MDYPPEFLVYVPLAGLFVRKIEGMENFPKKPFIAAANHSSYLDDILLPYAVFKACKRHFTIFINSRFYNNPLIKAFLDHYGFIPVDVSGKDKKKNEKAFKKALESLRTKPFLIFPEGTRSPDGKIKEGKTGIARLALSSKAPVIPIGIIGSYEIWPRTSIFPRPGRVKINIGKPIHFEKYHKKKITKKILREITDKIMKEIAKLSRQRYSP